MATLQRLASNLWFDNQAAHAANFYVSVFPNSKITRTLRFSDEGFEIHQRPAGSIMTVEFELDGNQFIALNGGPVFTFSEAISFVVYCTTQEEIDYYWDKLSAGGDDKAQQCGWLKDKYGVSWQVVPTILNEMLMIAESPKAKRAMHAMLQMKKLNIAELQKAYEGE